MLHDPVLSGHMVLIIGLWNGSPELHEVFKENSMKHAAIVNECEIRNGEKYVEAESADGEKIFLIEREYTDTESELFDTERNKWIICRCGTQYFLADSDSGEDARGSYCGYFDLIPSNAVFEQGRLVGYYLCPGSIWYSGRGRSSFEMERWGYPGYDLFDSDRQENKMHIFIFSDTSTHEYADWEIFTRVPGKEYRSYIDF